MKQFFTLVLCATVVFVGLGGLVERAGARFKSDEKALALLKKARQAVGGETAIASVKSMTISGKMNKTFAFDGTERTETGDLEINFELPGKLGKTIKLGKADGQTDGIVDKKVDVIVMKKGDSDIKWESVEGDVVTVDGVKKVVVKKDDGTEEVLTEDKKPMIIRRTDGNSGDLSGQTVNVDGKNVVIEKRIDSVERNAEFANMRQLELFRTTLSLLLTAPEGLDVSYNYAGEAVVDGVAVEVIDAQIGKGGVKLFLNKSTNLPQMMSFQGMKPVIIKINKTDGNPDLKGKTMVFESRMEAPEMSEIVVKFSDYRTVGGLQLPFKWTQTADGKADETVEITGYEINPANIADKFKEVPTKVMVRTQKQ